VEIRRFEGNELKQLEERHGITLPSAYRDFLCCVGASWLFVDKSNENKTGLMFCRIDDLLGVFAMRTKESLSSVFSDCIPIGYDYDNGRVLAIAEALFAILCQCGGYVICNTRWAFVLRR